MERYDKVIDLGLPSGRLWAVENVPDPHGIEEAKERFGNRIPSAKAWDELRILCKWRWKWHFNRGKRGYLVTGPNGNSIFLPVLGFVTEFGALANKSGYGYYWSRPTFQAGLAQYVLFGGGSQPSKDEFFQFTTQTIKLSVRLCQEPE